MIDKEFENVNWNFKKFKNYFIGRVLVILFIVILIELMKYKVI